MNLTSVFLTIAILAEVGAHLMEDCRDSSDCEVLISNNSLIKDCEADYNRTYLCSESDESCTLSGDGSTHKSYSYLSMDTITCLNGFPYHDTLGEDLTCSWFQSNAENTGLIFRDNFSLATYFLIQGYHLNYCIENDDELSAQSMFSTIYAIGNYSDAFADGYAFGWRVNSSTYNLRVCNTTSAQRSANESCVLGTRFVQESPVEITYDSSEKELTVQNNGKLQQNCTMHKPGYTLGFKVAPEATKVVPLDPEVYQLSDYLSVRCVSTEGYVTEATFYIPSAEMCIIHGCVQCWELFESLACLPVVWQVTLFIMVLLVVLALFSITPCLLPFTLMILSWISWSIKKLISMVRRQGVRAGAVAVSYSLLPKASACDVGGALQGTFTSCQAGVCSASYTNAFSVYVGQQACLNNKYISTKVTLTGVEAVYTMTFAYYTTDYHVETWTGIICQSPFEFDGCGEQSCEHISGNPKSLSENDLDRSSTRHAVHQYCYHKNIASCLQIEEACAVGRTYLKAVGDVYTVYKITSAVYYPIFRIDEFFNSTNHTSFLSGLTPMITNSSVYTVNQLSNIGTDDIIGMHYFYSADHSFIAPASEAGSPVSHSFGDIQSSGSGYLANIPIDQTANVVFQYESSTSFDNDNNKIHFQTHSSPFTTRAIQTRVPGGTRVANVYGNSSRLWGDVVLSVSASMTIESKSNLHLQQVVPNVCPHGEFSKTEGCYNCEPGARLCMVLKSTCDPGLASVILDGESFPVSLNNTEGTACFPFQSSTRSGSDQAEIVAGNNKAVVDFKYDLVYVNPNYKTYNTKGKTAEQVGSGVTGWHMPQWGWTVLIIVVLVVLSILALVFIKIAFATAKFLLKKNV